MHLLAHLHHLEDLYKSAKVQREHEAAATVVAERFREYRARANDRAATLVAHLKHAGHANEQAPAGAADHSGHAPHHHAPTRSATCAALSHGAHHGHAEPPHGHAGHEHHHHHQHHTPHVESDELHMRMRRLIQADRELIQTAQAADEAGPHDLDALARLQAEPGVHEGGGVLHVSSVVQRVVHAEARVRGADACE